MDSERTYLDHAATTPVRPEVLEAMWPFFAGEFGNPSSVHSWGEGPREALERAHAMVAAVLGCRPTEVIFTAGGTEADNLAVLGVARAAKLPGGHVVTAAIEHEAVLASCRALEREGFEVTYLAPDRFGAVSPDAVAAALRDDTVLVSIATANNEIGTVQPIHAIGEIVRARGIPFHTDAVQAAGLLDVDVEGLNVDLLSLSAHKLQGPKGAGALVVRSGIPLEPVIHGGGQERGRRSGTENLPGVVGLAVALALAARERAEVAARLTPLRDRLLTEAPRVFPALRPTGHPTERLPNHASFYAEGMSGESLLVNLDVAGIGVSSGSACRAGSSDPSHVLTAIGLTTGQARNGLRITLGRESTEGDVDRVLRALSALPEMVPA